MVSGTVSDGVPLEPGSSYLIEEERPEVSYRLLSARVGPTMPGLVITRQDPDRIRHERSLTSVRIVWLSRTAGKDSHDPRKTGDLATLIQTFIENNAGEGMILLDGIEYLIVNNGFPQTLTFIERLSEFIMQRSAVLLLPVNPETLEEKELALVKRTVKVFGPRSLRTVIRLMPSRTELIRECQQLRDFLPANSDIDESPRPLEERLREAQQSHIPFVVVVSGGENSSRILHVIDYRGVERWMSLESLKRACKEWESRDGR